MIMGFKKGDILDYTKSDFSLGVEERFIMKEYCARCGNKNKEELMEVYIPNFIQVKVKGVVISHIRVKECIGHCKIYHGW